MPVTDVFEEFFSHVLKGPLQCCPFVTLNRVTPLTPIQACGAHYGAQKQQPHIPRKLKPLLCYFVILRTPQGDGGPVRQQ